VEGLSNVITTSLIKSVSFLKDKADLEKMLTKRTTIAGAILPLPKHDWLN